MWSPFLKNNRRQLYDLSDFIWTQLWPCDLNISINFKLTRREETMQGNGLEHGRKVLQGQRQCGLCMDAPGPIVFPSEGPWHLPWSESLSQHHSPPCRDALDCWKWMGVHVDGGREGCCKLKCCSLGSRLAETQPQAVCVCSGLHLGAAGCKEALQSFWIPLLALWILHLFSDVSWWVRGEEGKGELQEQTADLAAMLLSWQLDYFEVILTLISCAVSYQLACSKGCCACFWWWFLAFTRSAFPVRNSLKVHSSEIRGFAKSSHRNLSLGSGP